MRIGDMLTIDRVLLDLRVRNKPRLLAEIASCFHRSGVSIPERDIEAALTAREQLGSTGLGAGFALPHARIERLDAYRGLFVRLGKPIDFDAIDGGPVHLVFALLMPASESSSQVAALAAVSRLFRDPSVRERLRTAKTADEAFQLLTKAG